MINRSKVILVVAALSFAGLTGVTASASMASATTDEMLTDPGTVGPGQIALRVFGNVGSGWSSHLFGENVNPTGKVTAVGTCSSMHDSACATANFWRYHAILPFCVDATSMDCIEAVTAQSSSGNDLPVTNVSKFPGPRGQDYVGD